MEPTSHSPGADSHTNGANGSHVYSISAKHKEGFNHVPEVDEHSPSRNEETHESPNSRYDPSHSHIYTSARDVGFKENLYRKPSITSTKSHEDNHSITSLERSLSDPQGYLARQDGDNRPIASFERSLSNPADKPDKKDGDTVSRNSYTIESTTYDDTDSLLSLISGFYTAAVGAMIVLMGCYMTSGAKSQEIAILILASAFVSVAVMIAYCVMKCKLKKNNGCLCC